jgi:putative transposase
MKTKVITRAYHLSIDPNFQKLEDLRYSASRYRLFLQHFTTQLYFKPSIKFFSTQGMGALANKAQKQAMGIVKGIRATGEKSNCPEIKFNSCPASISESKHTTFDYWVTVTSQWKNRILIPARSHRKLNERLREGFELSKHCEVVQAKNGTWQVRVFVSKEIEIPTPKPHFIGIDVGIAHGVTRSDKYLGKSLKKIMQAERDSQRERSRQKHLKKPFKTKLKQQLDTEVTRVLTRCKLRGWNLVVEHPKVLSNLRLDRWARSYFANRASERASEFGVYTIWVNPAYTSITCSRCGVTDKQSRVNQSTFKCSSCKKELNADYNASINIARKGQESLRKKAIKPLRGLQNVA